MHQTWVKFISKIFFILKIMTFLIFLKKCEILKNLASNFSLFSSIARDGDIIYGKTLRGIFSNLVS